MRNRAPGYNANGTLKKSKKSDDGHLKLYRSLKGTNDDDSCSASSQFSRSSNRSARSRLSRGSKVNKINASTFSDAQSDIGSNSQIKLKINKVNTDEDLRIAEESADLEITPE